MVNTSTPNTIRENHRVTSVSDENGTDDIYLVVELFIASTTHSRPTFSDVFRGLHARVLLEETGEVLGIFEAQRVGHLRHRQAADHHALGTVYEEVLDDLRGTVARDAAYHVAEITGREAPFESWLTIVTLTRNSCCHHARVWNK